MAVNPNLQKINRFVVLMLENRSFDHLMGGLKSVNSSIAGLTGAESIAAELDELPTAYKYDVKAFHLIALRPLREHIERVGITVYPREKE
jgi:hypothetical protein